jgi:Uma2 family endonuclease
MQEHVDEVSYYYDQHPTQEDLMGETAVHAALIHYLVDVLRWLFRGQRCAVYENLNFYRTSNSREYPLAPDIAVIKGVSYQEIPSWRVSKGGPPQVVFEILSEETWKKDIQEKPEIYGQMGVHEYFAYDPNTSPVAKATTRRLFGWRLDPQSGRMRPLTLRSPGSLWSSELASFLVANEGWLRLYEREGHLQLTGEEARAQQAEIEARRAQAEARRAELATQRAEQEARRAKALAEKLRSLGIDPDQI